MWRRWQVGSGSESCVFMCRAVAVQALARFLTFFCHRSDPNRISTPTSSRLIRGGFLSRPNAVVTTIMISKKPLCLLGRRFINCRITSTRSSKAFYSHALTRCSSCATDQVFKSILTTLPANFYSSLISPSEKKLIIFRGKAATSHQEQLLLEFVASHDEATSEEWQKLRDEILESLHGLINESNFDGRVVDACILPRKLALARSYLSFVRSCGRKFNSAIVCAFLRLCFRQRKSLTEEDLVRIDKFIKFLLTKYKVMDPIVGDAIIKGLILTGEGHKCQEIIRNIEKLSTPGSNTYSAYSIYLIQQNKPDEALNYARRYIEQVNAPDYEFFTDWFEAYHNDRCKLDESLSLLRDYDLKIDGKLCEIIASGYSRLPPKDRLCGTVADIDEKGLCQNCNTRLNELELADEEFDGLRDEVLNRVLVGTDVFKNTTPVELQHFRYQVARHSPFDLVIDGLNVAYMTGTNVGPMVTANMLVQTLRYYQNEGKKTFLIGRKHMVGWPTLLDNVKEMKIGYFLMDNVSEDDPFLIYSTMYSGKNTCFVTRDLLRSEKFVLPSAKMRNLFKRWQLRHQIVIKFMSASGKLYPQPAIDFEMTAQKSKVNGWHLPYMAQGTAKALKDDYRIHKTWFCLSPPIK